MGCKGEIDICAEFKDLYGAVLRQDWSFFLNHYHKGPDHLLFPLNVNRDSAFHLALGSKKKKPFKDLLQIVSASNDDTYKNAIQQILLSSNAGGNNILHEAATVGNDEVIDLLLYHYPTELPKVEMDFEENETPFQYLLRGENEAGESPLFTAAAFGRTEIMELLANQNGQMTNNKEISNHNRTRYDEKSILHAAIEGEHFDTAFKLLQLDQSLALLKDSDNKTALHILAGMPSAFRSGYTTQSIFDRRIYSRLDVDVNDEGNQVLDSRSHGDLEKWQTGNPVSWFSTLCATPLARIRSMIRNFIHGWSMVERIRSEKKKHKYAWKVAEKLTETNVWWKDFGNPQFNWSGFPLIDSTSSIPLFIATENGITDLVELIIRANPQSVEYLNEKGQNVLHVAVMHRRKDIFYLLKTMGLTWDRLRRKIDDNKFSLLHQAAHMKHFTGGTKPGPALELQEELQWYHRVKRAVPSHHALIRAELKKQLQQELEIKEQNENKVTPKELFDIAHKEQLKEAQEWIKNTSQSCSTVAILVATVVFAAAYTVPGGINEKGFPNFINSPYFEFFTVMDAIALSLSLSSVMSFLSILTSPLQFDDFYLSIPQKLTFGFILLFFSVITTILAFGVTIWLIIRSDKQWPTILFPFAAFTPVSIVTLSQFRLYSTLMKEAVQSVGFLCFGFVFKERRVMIWQYK